MSKFFNEDDLETTYIRFVPERYVKVLPLMSERLCFVRTSNNYSKFFSGISLTDVTTERETCVWELFFFGLTNEVPTFPTALDEK